MDERTGAAVEPAPRGRGLVEAIARELAERHGRLVRSWGVGRYLVADGDEALVLLAPNAAAPERLAALVDEVGWRTGGGRVRLVLALEAPQAATLAALAAAAARHPQLELLVLDARSAQPAAGSLPPGHPLERALAAARAGAEIGEATAGLRLRDALARAGRPWATIALIAANVVVFVLLVTGAQWDSIPALVGFGANAPELLRRGEWWRLATAMFVHVGPIHLAFNLWALWVLGSFFERLLGCAPLVVIYLLSGLFASLVSAWAHHAVSAGASGAIFGVFGLFAAVAWRPRGIVHPLVARALGRNVLFLLGLNILIGVSVPQIDLAAHLGGFALGLVLGLVLPLVRTDTGSPPRWLRVAAGVCALGLTATFALNLSCGLRYLQARDLGEAVVRTAGDVRLELPRKLEPRPLPGGRPGAVFERPLAGLSRVVVATAPLSEPALVALLDLEWTGTRSVEALRSAPPPEQRRDERGRTWWVRRHTLVEHGVAIAVESWRTILAGRVVQLEFAGYAGELERYRAVIEHALASVQPLPDLAPVVLLRPPVYGPWPRPATARALAAPPTTGASPLLPLPPDPFTHQR